MAENTFLFSLFRRTYIGVLLIARLMASYSQLFTAMEIYGQAELVTFAKSVMNK